MPKQSSDMYGNYWTGVFRVRNRPILGAVVEEKVEKSDGTVKWVKSPTYHYATLTRSIGS